jgi:hypothetical protein
MPRIQTKPTRRGPSAKPNDETFLGVSLECPNGHTECNGISADPINSAKEDAALEQGLVQLLEYASNDECIVNGCCGICGQQLSTSAVKGNLAVLEEHFRTLRNNYNEALMQVVTKLNAEREQNCRRTLLIEPIPAPLFGRNLRTKLGATRWSKLRMKLIENKGSQCISCQKVFENKANLHADEQWHYDISTSPALATLETVVLRCKLCHDTKHLMRSSVNAPKIAEDLLNHFGRVNGIGRRAAQMYRESVAKQWRTMSLMKWEVDLGTYESTL